MAGKGLRHEMRARMSGGRVLSLRKGTRGCHGTGTLLLAGNDLQNRAMSCIPSFEP